MFKRFVVSGTNKDDILPGTDRLDIMFGKNGDDVLDGRGGWDFLFGGKGNDKLIGGDGNDWLFGGKGKDELFGDKGNDKLFGGKGSDFLDGGAGSDKLFGGRGNDTFNFTLSENDGAKDYYDGGKGFDTLQLTLTSAELLLAQGEIDAFKAFLAEGSNKVFHFESFGLSVRDFEDIVIVGVGGGNTAPVAQDDEVPNTVPAAIRVAVVGGASSSYVDAAKQLSDSSTFNIAADAISVTAHMAEEDWAAALSSYDVVVVGDSGFGTDYSNLNGIGLFAGLRDFLDDGGGVVSTGWSAKLIAAYDPFNAQLSDDADYISPAAFSLDPFTTTEAIAVLDSSHAITQGIADSYAVQGNGHELALIDGTAVELAEGTSGMTAIAYDDSFEFGKSVYLGSLHMANGFFFNPDATRTGPVDQIFEQAVAWAAGDLDLVAATDEDTPLVIDDEFLFANDSDIDSDADMFAIAEVKALSALGAAVSINSDGDVLYDPTAALQHLSAGEVVEDSFSYKVSDGQGGTSDWASVSLSVLGQADTIV